MKIEKLSEKLLYKIGVVVSKLAKDKYAPVSKIRVEGHSAGTLKDDIYIRNLTPKSVTIGNTKVVSYAKFVHFGTGIYGDKKRKITPKKAKALKTPYGYRKSVKGIKANPYLANAANEYIKNGGLDRAVKSFSKEIVKDIKATLK
ncbi:hypothetical protein [Campylobacter geochelonis]|uniref:hypothetical protein n=1 Tax=Campylobacter geochelonis TaxID=1780362 RepID=UPI0007708E84|nr:hypothetical protein [Campylobacter geochelonis]CZE47905.1 Uncharacterised protein [Campylobacter geochelonis]